MALKMHFNDFLNAGNKVTPDELGYDQTYIVINPSIDTVWFGTTAVGGTTSTQAVVLTNKYADYPRNLNYQVAGSNALGGTWTVNGKDQFGNIQQESVVIATAVNGGSTLGTKIFSEVTNGTFSFISGSVGNGTPKLGVGTAGTTTLFGLPAKLGGTTDIKVIRGSFNGVGTSTSGTFVFGGTPSSAANTTVHAFAAPRDVAAGTVIYSVLYRSTYPVMDETVLSSVL